MLPITNVPSCLRIIELGSIVRSKQRCKIQTCWVQAKPLKMLFLSLALLVCFSSFHKKFHTSSLPSATAQIRKRLDTKIWISGKSSFLAQMLYLPESFLCLKNTDVAKKSTITKICDVQSLEQSKCKKSQLQNLIILHYYGIIYKEQFYNFKTLIQ